MTEEKSPLEQALDLFVYAPIGLAAMAREHLPDIIARGREQLTGQATMARMMGEFAVNEAQKEASKALRQAGATLSGLTGTARDGGPAPQTSAASPPAPSPTAAPEAAPRPAAAAAPPQPATPRPAPAPAAPPPAVDGLAIPGYDALSASQVVQRLAGLAADELEAVRAYESATRGRKTILHRIDQLQAGTA